jgi:hypothetical protein
LTKKFARRFVMGATVIIRFRDRYLGIALRREALASPAKREKGEPQMRKTILTVLGSALIVATSVQFAAAAQRHHHYGKTDRVVVRQQPRNVDAYAAWPAPSVQPDWYSHAPSYYSGGWSAPAGH